MARDRDIVNEIVLKVVRQANSWDTDEVDVELVADIIAEFDNDILEEVISRLKNKSAIRVVGY